MLDRTFCRWYYQIGNPSKIVGIDKEGQDETVNEREVWFKSDDRFGAVR